MRTFRGRSSYVLLTLFKSLVQPPLDYCSQLWSPTSQSGINKIEQVQKSLVSKITDSRLQGLNYWRKLKTLHLVSQECRRECYMIICIWKISQGLVSRYEIPFSSRSSRSSAPIPQSVPAAVKNSASADGGPRSAQPPIDNSGKFLAHMSAE